MVVVHGSMGEMSLDRRVHIRVWVILVMHCSGFVVLGERICGWRLHRVAKLSRAEGIVRLRRGEEMTRGGRGLRGVDILLLGLGPSRRIGRLEC